MDNIFVRSLTSKSKGRASDASVPSSPIKVLYLWIFPEIVYDFALLWFGHMTCLDINNLPYHICRIGWFILSKWAKQRLGFSYALVFVIKPRD